MYDAPTDAHLTDSLLHCSLFMAHACFNASASSSGISQSVPAKLHKPVHAVLVEFKKKKKPFTFVFQNR